MTTTPRLWKSQTLVNTNDAAVKPGGTANQTDGQIVRLPDGGYVVVWSDGSRFHNPGGLAVVGQRYDAEGSKVGGEVKLSLFLNGDQLAPAITALPNGNIAVAFVNLLSGDADILVRIFNQSLGVVRTDPIDTGASFTLNPSLTAFADGSYVVSYTVGSVAADTDIVAHIVSPTGVVGPRFDIHNESDNSDLSELATLSNGNFVAVNQDEFSGGDTDIRFGLFTPAGVAITTGHFVHGAASNRFETDPDVAALRAGGFVVVWTSPDITLTTDIRASIYSNTGSLVAGNILVNTTATGNQDEASVVALADGGFLVTWEDDNANLVRAQRFDAAGHKIGIEFTVKNGVTVADSPEAAVLTDGRIAYAIGDVSTGDFDVTTSIWTTDSSAVATSAVSAAGDFNSNGTQNYTARDAGATMTSWEYNAAAQQVMATNLGTVGFSWNILASDHFSNSSTDQMLAQNTADGTMSLWWVSNGQRVGVNIGQVWNGINYVANGQFTDAGGAGIASFLVTNVGDHHLYNWWIDANYQLQGIDLGAVWSNKSLVGTGAFTPNGGTDFLVANAGDRHLYDWWIDPASRTLQGLDLGAVWNNVGYIASGKFSANGGGNDNFLVFNAGDHHLYDWWIDPASHTLQGLDLGAAWNNVEFLAAGHFSDHTSYEQFLVRNTADNHLYEWWITPQGTLGGIDLGPAWSSSLEIVDSGNLNGSTINDEWLVHNTADGHFYQWFISNNQLAGVDLGVPFVA